MVFFHASDKLTSEIDSMKLRYHNEIILISCFVLIMKNRIFYSQHSQLVDDQNEISQIFSSLK